MGERLAGLPACRLSSPNHQLLWESDREGSAGLAAVQTDVTSVGDHDLVHQRKAKPCATFLGRIEGKEDLVPDTLGDTMACIGHKNADIIINYPRYIQFPVLRH